MNEFKYSAVIKCKYYNKQSLYCSYNYKTAIHHVHLYVYELNFLERGTYMYSSTTTVVRNSKLFTKKNLVPVLVKYNKNNNKTCTRASWVFRTGSNLYVQWKLKMSWAMHLLTRSRVWRWFERIQTLDKFNVASTWPYAIMISNWGCSTGH
jgi:hypothetical protein